MFHRQQTVCRLIVEIYKQQAGLFTTRKLQTLKIEPSNIFPIPEHAQAHQFPMTMIHPTRAFPL